MPGERLANIFGALKNPGYVVGLAVNGIGQPSLFAVEPEPNEAGKVFSASFVNVHPFRICPDYSLVNVLRVDKKITHG